MESFVFVIWPKVGWARGLTTSSLSAYTKRSVWSQLVCQQKQRTYDSSAKQLNSKQKTDHKSIEKATWWLNAALTVRKPSSVNKVLFVFCIPTICFISFHLLFGYLCFKPRHIRTQLGWIPDWVVLKQMLQSKHACIYSLNPFYRTGSCSHSKISAFSSPGCLRVQLLEPISH